MSFDWTEYHNLACELCGIASTSPSTEAKNRSAISRSYYSVFCIARNYLRDIDKILLPTDGSAHKVIKDQFIKSPDYIRRAIGVNLDRLRLDRRKADYDDDILKLPSLAKKDVITAYCTLLKFSAL